MAEGPSTGSSPGVNPQVSPGPWAGPGATLGASSTTERPERGGWSLKRPSGWMLLRSLFSSSCRSAVAGTSALTACSQGLTALTRAFSPAAATRARTESSEAVGRANSQTETVVSGRRASRRGNTEDTAGRCAASPAGRNRSQNKRRTKTGKGEEGRGTGDLHWFHLTEPHADNGRHARFLHRHAVHSVRRLHRPGIVRDDDELRLVLELGQEPHIAPDIGVIERRVDFVEQAERARFGEEDREQQRHGDQGALPGRQQVDSLRALPPRRGVDFDFALEGLVLVREAHVAFPAAKQCLENGPKVLAHFGKRLQEERLRGLIDFPRRLLQRVAGRHEIVPLRLQGL